MDQQAALQNKLLQEFLKSRKSEETRKYVRVILDYLSKEKKNIETQGWVQSKDLVSALVGEEGIPNSSTFYKLVKDLESAHLIERRKGKKEIPRPGRPPIYYRVPLAYVSIWFLTKDEIIQEWDKTLEIFYNVASQRNVALVLLMDCRKKEGDDLQQLYKEIKKEVKEEAINRYPPYPKSS